MYSVVQEIEGLPSYVSLLLRCCESHFACCHTQSCRYTVLLLCNALAWWCTSLCACTWPLLCGAGDNPLDETTLHQRFTREPWFLPLGAVCLSTLVWVFPVGIRQQATIHCLPVRLRKTEKKLYAEREKRRQTS